MKKVYVLYDSSICYVIRVYSDMEKAITTAINRITIYSHTCVSFSFDKDDSTVIEYIHHDTGELCTLTIQAADLEED